METYKDIPSYEGYYQASDLGNIRSVARTIFHPRYEGNCELKSKVLATALDIDGYLLTHLSKDGKKKLHKTHRLVALAFHPNPNNLPQVNHKNGIKADNRPGNLEWISAKENLAHAARTSLRQTTGAGNGKAKLTAGQVVEIRAQKSMYTCKQLADKYGVDAPCIWKIITYKTWKHLEDGNHSKKESVGQGCDD